MTTSPSEEMFVGLVALALIPWTVWTIVRGLRQERLPIGRGHVGRNRRAAFGVLLGFYVLAGLFAVFVAADLLFNLDIRNSL